MFTLLETAAVGSEWLSIIMIVAMLALLCHYWKEKPLN